MVVKTVFHASNGVFWGILCFFEESSELIQIFPPELQRFLSGTKLTVLGPLAKNSGLSNLYSVCPQEVFKQSNCLQKLKDC